MATPQDSVAPPPLTDGGPVEPSPGRAAWVQFSIDLASWFNGLSPAGASKYEATWQDLTASTGWSQTVGQTPQIMREGKTIWSRGAFTRAGTTAGQLAAICQVPPGFFDPTQNRFLGAGVTSTGLPYELTVTAAGLLSISGYTTITTATGFVLPIAGSIRLP